MPAACKDEQQRSFLEACGERLDQVLTARGWKGPDLAAALGVHRSTVHGYLRGTLAMSIDQLGRIADILGVAPGFLLPPSPNDPLAPLDGLLLQTPPEIYADVIQQVATLLKVYHQRGEKHRKSSPS